MFGVGGLCFVLCLYLAAMGDLQRVLEQINALSAEDKAKAVEALAVKPDPDAADVASAGVKSLPIHTSSQAKLSNFSGDRGAKGEVSFDQWRFEVRALTRDKIYHEGLVLQAIQRSVRGSAAEILMTLGETVTVETILEKFDHLFGNVLPAEVVLEQFYGSRQKSEESVASWACRLEDLLAQVSRKQTVSLSKEAVQGMLRTKFYSGLHTGIRDKVRHKFDNESATYDDLLVLARTAELEEQKEKEKDKAAKVSQAVVADSELSKKMDRVLSALDTVNQRLDKLEGRQGQSQQKQGQQPQQSQPSGASGSSNPQGGGKSGKQGGFRFRGRCFTCGKWGHRNFECQGNSQQPASGGSQ